MYANNQASHFSALPRVRTTVLCLLFLPALLGPVRAQTQKPAKGVVSSSPGIASTPSLPADVGGDGEEERARILRKIANDIAYLRQQQALVEAQSALAKARAELASVGTNAAHSNNNTVQVAGAPAVPTQKAASKNGTVQLTGIQGNSKRRWASVVVGDGPVQQVEAGSAVGGWRVLEVRLNEVLLEPLGKGGEPTLLRVEGSVQRAPDVAQSPRKGSRVAKPE
jgi:type IV pilus biogenesis protein PilP